MTTHPHTRSWLSRAANALRTHDTRFPWVHPTDEEDDIAAVLDAIDDEHQPTADTPDHRGHYGPCTSCHHNWPCPEQRRGERLAILWLGRAADRYTTHALTHHKPTDHTRATTPRSANVTQAASNTRPSPVAATPAGGTPMLPAPTTPTAPAARSPRTP